MTVSATARKAGPFAGNGVTTVYPFQFKVFTKADIQVILTDANGAATVLVLDSDYSVSLNTDQDASPGGAVTYPIVGSPLAAGLTLTTIGNLGYDQATSLANSGRYLPEVVERTFDKVVILIQQLKEISGRTLQAAVGTTVNLIFPAPGPGKFIKWRSDGLGLENVDAGTDSMALQGLLADAGDVLHGSALIGLKVNLTGSVGRTLSSRLSDTPTVKDFGAKGDGVTNDTAAFNAALLAGTCIRVPAGTYILNGTVNITRSGQKLIGDGPSSTILTATTNNLPAVSVSPFLTNWEIAGFTLNRSVTAIAGGDGISAPTSCSQSHIHDLVVQGHWRGIVCGSTDYSRISNVVSQQNFNHGFFFTNQAGSGAMQWYMNNCLSSRNDGSGFVFQASAGPGAVALGTIDDCATFANSGRGIAFLGLVGVPINGIRLTNGFFGEDGDHEVFLDTYGALHSIRATFAELAGRGSTGVLGTTPPTLLGSGFFFSGNNRDVLVADCRSDANARNGLATSALSTVVTGGAYTGNGVALVAFNRNGISCGAGRLVVSGAIIGDYTLAYQEFGVVGASGDDTSVIGCDLSSNITAPFSASVNPGRITAIGNLPNTSQTLLYAAGGIGVGGVTPAGAGTINVSGDLAKNGTVYTNP